MSKKMVLLFVAVLILSVKTNAQTITNGDTTKIVSEYAVSIVYPDKTTEWGAKLLGIHTDKLILKEEFWTVENGQKEFLIKLEGDNGKIWFTIASDTAKESFLIDPSQFFKPKQRLLPSTIRFIRNLKLGMADQSFKRMNDRIIVGNSELDAVAEKIEERENKDSGEPEKDVRYFSVYTMNDNGRSYIRSTIAIEIFQQQIIYPYAFFDLPGKVNISVNLKSVTINKNVSVRF